MAMPEDFGYLDIPRRIQLTRLMRLDEFGPGEKARFWIKCGILHVPYPEGTSPRARRDKAQLRSDLARAEWRERVERKRKVRTQFRRITIERAGNRCEYCGIRPGDGKLEIDHIRPVTRGGGGSLDNLAAACHTCNFSKYDFLIEEWLDDWQKKVFEYRLQKVREIFPDAFKRPELPPEPEEVLKVGQLELF